MGRLGSSTTDSTFAAGLRLLEAWARYQDDGPVAIVVEDLHWAEAASSKALLCAAQRLDEDRVVLIVTARPGVPRRVGERMRADPQRCRRISLSALSAEDVAALAGAHGIDLTSDQAERLHRHTGGHPLYVRTLLTELSPAELRMADGDLPAPSSLTSAVTAGLSEVRESRRRLAAAMAVVNQRVGLAQIGRVAGVDAPIEPFEELLGTGFVHWDPDEPGSPVEFVHPLYRQAIYRDLSPRTPTRSAPSRCRRGSQPRSGRKGPPGGGSRRRRRRPCGRAGSIGPARRGARAGPSAASGQRFVVGVVAHERSGTG